MDFKDFSFGERSAAMIVSCNQAPCCFFETEPPEENCPMLDLKTLLQRNFPLFLEFYKSLDYSITANLPKEKVWQERFPFLVTTVWALASLSSAFKVNEKREPADTLSKIKECEQRAKNQPQQFFKEAARDLALIDQDWFKLFFNYLEGFDPGEETRKAILFATKVFHELLSLPPGSLTHLDPKEIATEAETFLRCSRKEKLG